MTGTTPFEVNFNAVNGFILCTHFEEGFMKLNIRIGMCIAVLAMVGAASAQTTCTQLWKDQAGNVSFPWILATGDQTRGLGKGASGNVLVASRVDTHVHRIDPATGSEVLPVLPDTALFAGGTFVISKVSVAGDGKIYVANLQTGAGTGIVKIYRWNNETDASPVTLVNLTSSPYRTGDDFVVIGSGTGTKLLLSGSGGNVARFTTADGNTFTSTTLGSPFPLGGSVTPHLSWDPNGTDFWVRLTQQGNSVKYDGTTLAAGINVGLSATPASSDNGFGPINVATYASTKILALGIGASAATTSGKPILIYDANVAAPSTLLMQAFNSENEPGGANTNGNGTGANILDTANSRLYNLYTNNSVSAYVLPTSDVRDWNLY